MNPPCCAILGALLPLATLRVAAAPDRPASAQASVLPEDEREKFLSEIGKLRERSSAEAQATLLAAKSALEQALSSETNAVQLYTESIRTTEFRGRANGPELFREWRKRNDESLSSRENRAAIRRHIEYLLLTIKALAGSPKDPLNEELLAYALAFDAQRDIDRAHPLLAGPIGASPIALSLGITMPKIPWIAEAGNTNAMFERVLLPWMRERKDPRLLDYWNLRIASESEAARGERVEFRAGAFERVEKLRLLWGRARDAALLGHGAAAIREMIGVLRTNPGHPDFTEWAAELEELLKSPSTATDAKESAAAP